MIYGNSKRIVVVRGIPSNFIEEAILILKHEPGSEGKTTVSGKTSAKDGAKVNTEYLIKEAETIINSYITENKLNDKYQRKVVPGKKLFNRDKKLINVLLNLGLVISIGLLIFVISKFI